MVSQETMRGQRVLETMYKSLNPSIWILVTLLGSFVFMAFGVRLDDELQFLQRKHYQVKLANGQNRCEGRVEVYYNGTWGTVCDDEWDMLDAQVICRQLDCGIAVALGNSTQYAQTSIPIVLDNVDCNGSETNLGYCDSLGWGIHNCYHYEDVTIKCREPLMVGAKASGDITTPPPKNAVVDGTVRLVGGIDSCQGRVEIYYQGHWGTVCDDDWDTMDAMVVCRQLGCAQVLLAPIRSFFGHGTGDILLDNVNCMGLEEQLSQCPHRGWRNHNCHHHEDAGIICSITNVDVTATEVSNIRTALPTKAPMALRVVSKYGSCQGRVEVQYNNVWGTVCDDGWDMPNAIVVCRQLGCGAAIEAKSQAAFGSGSGPILLDNVQCTGTETHLSQCIHSGVGQHNCAHHEDAGVICTPINPSNGLIRDFRATDEMAPRDPTASTSSTEGAVRLVDGEHECEGRVEMYLNSEWGTVCDDAWDIPDANVVCRQVGCGEAIAAWGEAHFGQGTGTVLFDNLKCNGREVSLQNCSHIDWNMHNCDHSEDAGVTCSRS